MSQFKIDGAEYENRKEALRQVIDQQGTEKVLSDYTNNPTRTLFDLYHKVAFDRRNEDDHPWYVSGREERVLPFEDVNWEIYPNDSDDRHLGTMLKRAIHELLPETQRIDRNRGQGNSLTP